ncbi:hypothetical protein NM688_g3064 [Phlebia brevispora]|uniref:Uncharacterized protein n=1 Tax=Phlebia brevispora TaxID=194682 RepID=A0ACC1T6R4_9APHY|nr:hypothetical protein NM688_g3064 [Phlebia brevispora]
MRVVSSEVGPVTQVPLEYFIEHVLPPLHPNIDIDTVLQDLRRAGRGNRHPITRSGRWWGFGQDPTSTKHSVSRSYIHFPKIVDAIVKYRAPHGMNPSVDFMHNPKPIPPWRKRGETAFPDAFMLLRGASKSDVKWTDIWIVGEYDKIEPSSSVIAKMNWSIARALEDPRRRFIFGYTVENTSMKLWFFHRTEAIFSTSFNFITESRTLTHVLLAFLYAEPHQLGWDTTMIPVSDDEGNLQYDFTIENFDGSKSLFRSLKLIYGGQSATLRRRGTRIWEVVQIINGVPCGSPLVLKDSWIHEESAREGASLRRVQLSHDTDDFLHTFSTHFLTVTCDGDVLLHSSRRPPSRDHSQQHVKACRLHPPLEIGTSDSSPLSGRKVHYRVVFKELCKPLDLEMPLSDIFRALGQVCIALKLLHEAGWVHRDVSMNNIMLDSAGQARLADLEYAKKMGDEAVPEFRVGTVPFMSSEVHSQTFWCGTLEAPPMISVPRSPDDGLSHNSDDSSSSLPEIHKIALAAAKKHARRCTPSSPREDLAPLNPPPAAAGPSHPRRLFRYNPLHDLESVFWIATYCLFQCPAEGISRATAEQQAKTVNRVLYDRDHHCAIIRLDGEFEQDLASLPPSLRELGRILETLRSKLTARYYAAEKDRASITSSVAAGLHDEFADILDSIFETQDAHDFALAAIDKNIPRLPRSHPTPKPIDSPQSLVKTPNPQSSADGGSIKFRYNPLHDLESLWFCECFPEPLKPLGQEIEHWRVRLCNLYERLENDPSSIDQVVPDTLHKSLMITFDNAARDLGRLNLTVVPWDQETSVDLPSDDRARAAIPHGLTIVHEEETYEQDGDISMPDETRNMQQNNDYAGAVRGKSSGRTHTAKRTRESLVDAKESNTSGDTRRSVKKSKRTFSLRSQPLSDMLRRLRPRMSSK